MSEISNQDYPEEKSYSLTNIITFCVFIFFAFLFARGCEDTGPTVTITDGAATSEIMVHSMYGRKLTAYQTLEDIFSIIKNNPSIDNLTVDIKLSSHGITDKYGNAVDDMDMGTLVFDRDQVAEIRRYNDVATFAYSDSNHEWMKRQLGSLRYAHLLRDEQ